MVQAALAVFVDEAGTCRCSAAPTPRGEWRTSTLRNILDNNSRIVPIDSSLMDFPIGGKVDLEERVI
jgi:hypothetical protein